MPYFAQNLQMISKSSRLSTCPVGFPGLIRVKALISSPSLSTAVVLLSSNSRSVIAHPLSSSVDICNNTLKLGQDVVWIEVPYSGTKKVSVDNATKSKINMGFGADDIRPAANADFLKANKDIEKMLKKASIPLADIAAQNMKMNAGEKSERAIKKHAAEWIKANQSTFNSWIK